MSYKVLFLGTSHFAKNCLDKLYQSSLFHIQSVWTKPDAPSGKRGLLLKPSPVKELCVQKNIPCLTPHVFPKKTDSCVKNLNIDVVIVIAYGVILPSYFLDQFKVVNIHASLLPRWRGAAPVPYSLLHGDSKTGVSLQEVAFRLDTGDVIRQIEFPLLPEMDAQDVFKKMEEKTHELLLKTLPLYLQNKIQPQKQDESLATYAPKIKNSDLRVNWNQPAQKVLNSIRAFVTEGGVYTYNDQQRIKIFKAELSSLKGSPGAVLESSRNLIIACSQGALSIKEVQRDGRKKQAIEEFMRGFKIKNDVFK